MSKRKKRAAASTQLNDAIPPSPAIGPNNAYLNFQDTFSNPMARLGLGTPNMMEGTQYVMNRLTRNYNLLNTLYRNNWLVERIVNTVSEDMLKSWINYETDITPEEITLIQRVERKTGIKSSLLEGSNWGRLYGGAAGVMVIDGQEDILDEPLDLDSIMPGDFKRILIADRWSGVYPDMELVDDVNSPDWGLPKFYEFRSQIIGETMKVHHSRVLRFIGKPLPNWEDQAEVHWGSSVVENIYEEIKRWDNTLANIANLIFRKNIFAVFKEGLGPMLANAPEQAQQNFYGTLSAQNQLLNNFSMLLLNAKDRAEMFNFSLDGLDDICEMFMLNLSGAAGMPVTRLFGRSPAGLNATGESDSQNYYNMVEQLQESRLRPILDKLLPVVCMSAIGKIPDDLEYTFNPVEIPSEDKAAEIVKAKVDAIIEVFNTGELAPQVFLREIKQTGEGFGMFTNITDEDIAKASADAPGSPLAMMAEGGLEEKPDEPKE